MGLIGHGEELVWLPSWLGADRRWEQGNLAPSPRVRTDTGWIVAGVSLALTVVAGRRAGFVFPSRHDLQEAI